MRQSKRKIRRSGDQPDKAISRGDSEHAPAPPPRRALHLPLNLDADSEWPKVPTIADPVQFSQSARVAELAIRLAALKKVETAENIKHRKDQLTKARNQTYEPAAQQRIEREFQKVVAEESANLDVESYLPKAWSLVVEARSLTTRNVTGAEFIVAEGGGSDSLVRTLKHHSIIQSRIPFKQLCDPDRPAGTELFPTVLTNGDRGEPLEWHRYTTREGFEKCIHNWFAALNESEGSATAPAVLKKVANDWISDAEKNGIEQRDFVYLHAFRHNTLAARVDNIRHHKQRKHRPA
jgi:hypothetical protein